MIVINKRVSIIVFLSKMIKIKYLIIISAHTNMQGENIEWWKNKAINNGNDAQTYNLQ